MDVLEYEYHDGPHILILKNRLIELEEDLWTVTTMKVRLAVLFLKEV